MRQSNIFFVVAILVLIWFGAEAFPGGQICVTSCFSLSGMNLAEQILAVVILPVLIALAGVSMRRTETQRQSKSTESTSVNAQKQEDADTDSERKPPQP